MENNSSLDLLQLYKQCISSLSFSFPDGVIDVDEDKRNLVSILLDGQPIPMAYHNEAYVSPLLLHDKTDDVYYPVGFFKAIYVKDSMLVDDQLPILNEAFKAFLKRYQWSMKESFSWKDVVIWPEQFELFIVQNSLVNKLELVPYFSFCGSRTLTMNSLFPLLDGYIHGKEWQPKYESMFRKISDVETEGQINENTYGFFAREQRVMERLTTYAGAKISLQGKGVFDDFMLNSVRFLREKNKSVVFVLDEKDEALLRSFLNDYHLSSFGKTIQNYSWHDMLSFLSHDDYEEITPKEEIMIRKYREKKDLYFRLEKEKHELFHYSSELKRRIPFVQAMEYVDQGYETYPIDLDSYSEEDYVRDLKFFDVADSSLASMKDILIDEHPFYGLTLAGGKENYQWLSELIRNIASALESLMEQISSMEWMLNYGVNVSSLAKIQDMVQDGTVLSQYTGFPRKYFRINQETEHQYDLNRLKKAFQSLSSSSLLLKSLIGDHIQNEATLKEALENYHSDRFFRKHRGQRQIKKMMLHPSEDLETVARVLGCYLQAKGNLEQILPVYVSIYGDNISNMNGVVEIQSNIEYIQNFYRRGEEEKTFSMDNPLVKRCFRDKQFRLMVVDDLSRLGKSYENIKQLLQEYYGCYQNISYSNCDEILLCSLLEQFYSKQKNTENQFNEYVLFRDALHESSFSMQLIVRKNYMSKKRKLLRFREEFYLSLLKSYYQHYQSLFAEKKEMYLSAKRDYLASLMSERNYVGKELCDIYHSQLSKLKKNEENRDTLKAVLDAVTEKEVQKKDFASLFSLLVQEYPISICLTKDLYSVPDEAFDNAIVLNSAVFSASALISSYRIAKQVLFVSYEQESDKRIQGYHETVVNKESLYYKSVDVSALGKGFPAMVTKVMGDSYRFMVNDPVFPLVLDGETKLAVFPDSLITYPIDDDSLMELSDYLAREENVGLYQIDSYQLLFDQVME